MTEVSRRSDLELGQVVVGVQSFPASTCGLQLEQAVSGQIDSTCSREDDKIYRGGIVRPQQWQVWLWVSCFLIFLQVSVLTVRTSTSRTCLVSVCACEHLMPSSSGIGRWWSTKSMSGLECEHARPRQNTTSCSEKGSHIRRVPFILKRTLLYPSPCLQAVKKRRVTRMHKHSLADFSPAGMPCT